MKKILLGMLLLIFAVSCSQKPESTVSKFIDGIKRQKIEETYKKYALDNKSENDLKLEYNNKFQQLFFETLFKNIDYKIEKVHKQDDETSIVTVSVENVDVEKVFLKVYKNMLDSTFSSGNAKSVEDSFKEELESKDVPKSKNETQFIVKKTSNGYKIDVTAENIDVLLGKFNTTFRNLNKLGENDSQQSSTEPNSSNAQLPKSGPNVDPTQVSPNGEISGITKK